jgi:hypothetical protein
MVRWKAHGPQPVCGHQLKHHGDAHAQALLTYYLRVVKKCCDQSIVGYGCWQPLHCWWQTHNHQRFWNRVFQNA